MTRFDSIDLGKITAKDALFFLEKEMERVDETILEPLTGTEWPRDMPVITGGGLVESVASIDVAYGSSGGKRTTCFLRRPTTFR